MNPHDIMNCRSLKHAVVTISYLFCVFIVKAMLFLYILSKVMSFAAVWVKGQQFFSFET